MNSTHVDREYNPSEILVPKGSRISDFPELSPAEKQLISCVREGKECQIGEGSLPLQPNTDNQIRAEFLRFLLLGGDSQVPVHAKGVDVVGAAIKGKLDLDGCLGMHALVLTNCVLNDFVNAVDAEIQLLALINVRIEGHDEEGRSLFADRIRVKGDLQIAHRSQTAGSVYLGGARIGGVLSFIGASLAVKSSLQLDEALFADGLATEGDVFLSDDFRASCEVRLLGSSIRDSLVCTGGNFRASQIPDNNLKEIYSDALSLSHCSIGRTLMLDVSSSTGSKSARIEGGLNLQGARTQNLADSIDAIPSSFISDDKHYLGYVVLDGFTYHNLVDTSPTDAMSRLEWLSRSPKKYTTATFRAQPYLQLARVLTDSGHVLESHKVLIEMENARRRSGAMTRFQLFWHSLMGVLISYGYRPWKVLYFGALFWFVGVIVFSIAWRAGDLVPAQPIVAMKEEYRVCRELTHPTLRVLDLKERMAKYDHVRKCQAEGLWQSKKGESDMSDYPAFSYAVYPLDLLLPIVTLRQEEYWLPSAETTFGRFARGVQWFLTGIGWFLTAIGAAALTGLVKSEQV